MTCQSRVGHCSPSHPMHGPTVLYHFCNNTGYIMSPFHATFMVVEKGLRKSCLMLWCMHVLPKHIEVDKTWTCTCTDPWVCMYSHFIYHRLGLVLFIYPCNYHIQIEKILGVWWHTMWSIGQNSGQFAQNYLTDMNKCDTVYFSNQIIQSNAIEMKLLF